MPRITLSKKPQMPNNMFKIRPTRQKDIIKEKRNLLKTLLKKKHNKLKKNLDHLLETFLKENRISETLPIKS